LVFQTFLIMIMLGLKKKNYGTFECIGNYSQGQKNWSETGVILRPAQCLKSSTKNGF